MSSESIAVEAHRQASHLGERLRSLLQGIDLPCLPVRQQAARLDAQRSGNHRRDSMTGFGISDRLRLQRGGRYIVGPSPFGPPPGSEQPLQIGAAACVAALLDVVKQMSSAPVPILPALGKEGFEIPW